MPTSPPHNSDPPLTNQQILAIIEAYLPAVRRELKQYGSQQDDCKWVLNTLIAYLKNHLLAPAFRDLGELENKVKDELNNVGLIKFNKGLRSLMQNKNGVYHQLHQKVKKMNSSPDMPPSRAKPS